MPSIGVNLRVTGYCNQGGRKYMEDMFSVAYQQTPDMKDLEYAFFGIFDGHGGSEAAAYAKDHLLDTIIKDDAFWSKNDDDVLRAIRNGYVNTHIEMWKNLENWPRTPSGLPNTSGTTASIAFIMRGKIYTGHVGDSCIVLGYQDEENGEWKAKPLTRDHKPESFEEKLRIEECGGKVINKSGVPRVVWNRPRIGHKGPVRRSTTIDEIPFLAVARALGDFWSFNSEHNKFVVSPEPDVEVFNVDPSKHRCLIFGTDGLWNVLSADVAISNVYATEKHNIEMKSLEKQDWLNPSKNLVDKAILQWNKVRLRADNTTVITLMLDPPGPPAPQVLLKHKMQTGNMKCEDKNSCKCVDGDPQVQRFGRGTSGGYAIFTRYPTDHHLRASSAHASTSKPCPNPPIETPPIKTNKVLRTSAKINNNNNNNNSSSKKDGEPAGKRCTRTSSGRIVKKQKLNEKSTNDETSKFGNSDSENEQMPREPWLLSPTKSIKPDETKVGVVLRSSGKIQKVWKCNDTKEDSTPAKITTISKIKTPLTEPMTRILRSHKKKDSRRFKKVVSRSSWSAGMVTRSHRRSVKY
ncbi:protein phosphatase 1D [Melanaphis sacchari]|uniref:protein phosphatase 1D n=1 Tax=Melanaphis sacchari TaxID=742174 RepID=UPI000DC15722|nr:protein phosphatase 1D [Melanaphis sacchari]